MAKPTNRPWTRQEVLATAGQYRQACVLAAGAELDLFTRLRDRPSDARALAERIGADARALTALLDALAAMGLLVKQGGKYRPAPGVPGLLAEGAPDGVLGMVRHNANGMRRWSQLARVVLTGSPAKRTPSVRGEGADLASFIAGMDEISRPLAPVVIGALAGLKFRRLLDIGGASGTWTIAFLRRFRRASAMIFDLPEVVPMARRRIAGAGLSGRAKIVGGDFATDALPKGADLAWVSAIVHQNSRLENRALFAKVFAALSPGGRIAIRDILVDRSRTSPPDGAMFAVNMLVATNGGGTYTLAELAEDLESAGFRDAVLARKGTGMDSVILAGKP